MSRTFESQLHTGAHCIRAHCFPDIALDAPSRPSNCKPGRDRFQRASFANPDGACSGFSDPDKGNDIVPGKEKMSIDEIESKAYQKGLAEGEKKGFIRGQESGRERGRQEVEPALSCLEQALQQVQNLRRAVHRHIEKEVVELALAIARKVVDQEVHTSKDVIRSVTHQALKKIEEPGKLKIKISPSDLQIVKASKHHFAEVISSMTNVCFEAEETIASGGCLIETDQGEIDARIETQLRAVAESFQKEFKKLEERD